MKEPTRYRPRISNNSIQTYIPSEKIIPNESKIFIRDNLTDFEKLLFAKKEIEDLKKELKIRDDKIIDLNIEIGKLNSYIEELRNDPKFKTNTQLINKKIHIKQLEEKLKKLTIENQRLLEKLILKNKINE
jgi:hypothetical protein